MYKTRTFYHELTTVVSIPAVVFSAQDITEMDATLHADISRAYFIGTMLAAMIYGCHACLFARTLTYYLKSSRLEGRSWKLSTYFCILFLLATSGLALQLQWTLVVFIDNFDYVGGPFAFLQNRIHDPINYAVTVVYLALNWFTDGILLWRFYTLFEKRWCALLPSVVVLLALIVVGLTFLSDLTSLSINLWTDAPTAPGIAYMSLSLGINVFFTLLIVVRLLYIYKHMHMPLGRSYRQLYMTLLWSCIKSVSFSSILAFLGVVSIGIETKWQAVLLPMLGQMLAIPPLFFAVQVIKAREQPDVQHKTFVLASKDIEDVVSQLVDTTTSGASLDDLPKTNLFSGDKTPSLQHPEKSYSRRISTSRYSGLCFPLPYAKPSEHYSDMRLHRDMRPPVMP
ncbi:hypothetical protein B0H21DRAFT_111586 [Amylocystis lapponica]|nr:hypothetical protein B0H21DRAFT_111586 [Amylocystis lapponica]